MITSSNFTGLVYMSYSVLCVRPQGLYVIFVTCMHELIVKVSVLHNTTIHALFALSLYGICKFMATTFSKKS